MMDLEFKVILALLVFAIIYTYYMVFLAPELVQRFSFFITMAIVIPVFWWLSNRKQKWLRDNYRVRWNRGNS